MNRFKDVIVDIIVLGAIIAHIFVSNQILEVVLWVYSGLLLLSKLLALFMPLLQSKANKTSVSDWFYHGVYLISVSALIYSHNYYLAGIWALIWILSIVYAMSGKSKKKK